MKFSMASADITPDKPVFMHGYGARKEKSKGVLDPLYMKAVLLQANRALLLVTMDVLGADRSFVIGMKEALRQQLGFKPEDVLFNFSHTHHSVFLTGPDPQLRRGGYSMGQTRWAEDESELDYAEDESYYAFIRDTLLKLTAACLESLEDCELLLGSGSSDFAISRRRPRPDGGVAWQPYYEADIDKELSVIKLVDKQAAVKGIIYSYGCHPTSMGSDQDRLSNDFIGTTSAVLEKKYAGATAMFLQGCAAELKPRHSAEGDRFVKCGPARTQEAGRYLADHVIEVMERGEFRRVDCFCYIPSRKMIGEGGYEAENNYYFGLRGPFVPEIEDILVGQVAQAIK